jgi:signal transduction histidine kinase
MMAAPPRLPVNAGNRRLRGERLKTTLAPLLSSPPAWLRALREPLPRRALLGMFGVLALAGLVSQWLDGRVTSQLEEKVLRAQRASVQRDVQRLNSELHRAEANILRFAELISNDPQNLTEIHDQFDQLVEQGSDGAWRSRSSRYHPNQEAGLWVPPQVPRSLENRLFLQRAQTITSLFGQGADNHLVENTWMLPLSGGAVMFWPSNPDFIRRANANLDYRNTPWIQQSAPAVSRDGHAHWTPPAYNPAGRAWLVSVVAPFFRKGSWAGAVGHDIKTEALIHCLSNPTERSPLLIAELLYLSDAQGRLINGAPDDNPNQDKLPAPLMEALKRHRGQNQIETFLNGEDHLIMAPISTLKAYAIYRMDVARIRQEIKEELGWIRLAEFLALGLLSLWAFSMLVREATYRLKQDELHEQRNYEMQLFVGAVSHELRTPLTLIRGHLSRLLRKSDKLSDPQIRTLTIANEETKRVISLANDLLDICRGDYKQLTLGNESLDITALLRECRDLASGLSHRTLELSGTDATAILAHGNADRLKQVLLNLIENADKFSPTDRPIKLQLRKDNGWVCIDVIDQGIGVPEAERERIFERFFRASNASERTRGSGLGLSVAQLLCQAMGGDLRLTASDGSGSTFSVVLPPA